MTSVESLVEEAQHALRVQFRNPDTLAEAFVHRSILNESAAAGMPSNERLEFLGDAILGAVVAHELFSQRPDSPEGELTELRSALVQRSALAGAARRLDLGRWLRLGRGEELAGGRDRDANLARVYEAVVGAIYLDRGYAAATRFVLRSLKADLERLEGGHVVDAKTRLQWVVQRRWQQPPTYTTISAEGPDHAKTFVVHVSVADQLLGEGSGSSRRSAEQAAAASALDLLETEQE